MIKQSSISIPGSLSAFKKFVDYYLRSRRGAQNIFELGKNLTTLEVLHIVGYMLNNGFYYSLTELKGIAEPMIAMLNGSKDVYRPGDSPEGANDHADAKRYFGGSDDVIVQIKATICENLLIISRFEIDGKV